MVFKGILTVEDTRRVAVAGADGIVVSNHRGRAVGRCGSLPHRNVDDPMGARWIRRELTRSLFPSSKSSCPGCLPQAHHEPRVRIRSTSRRCCRQRGSFRPFSFIVRRCRSWTACTG
ncbi:hypothetical protein CF165_12620 [Amycolatopsis vastitatis]|uniref:FMN-dependent dehydrogenase domain-containing protein n=1 Tax=Amycolatopsis vastitatis TaxID=1905142 RepID=A0A229TAU1_9PSEU|nr:hypothetical protein CF165_12620 [Amycolatopsis vastitatis]